MVDGFDAGQAKKRPDHDCDRAFMFRVQLRLFPVTCVSAEELVDRADKVDRAGGSANSA